MRTWNLALKGGLVCGCCNARIDEHDPVQVITLPSTKTRDRCQRCAVGEVPADIREESDRRKDGQIAREIKADRSLDSANPPVRRSFTRSNFKTFDHKMAAAGTRES